MLGFFSKDKSKKREKQELPSSRYTDFLTFLKTQLGEELYNKVLENKSSIEERTLEEALEVVAGIDREKLIGLEQQFLKLFFDKTPLYNKVEFVFSEDEEADYNSIFDIKDFDLEKETIKISPHKKHIAVAQVEESNTLTYKDVVRRAIYHRASDIHINYSVALEKYFFYFRIDGRAILIKELTMSKNAGDNFVARIRQESAEFTKGNFSADKTAIHQDAKLIYSYPEAGIEVDIRNAFATHGLLGTENTLVSRLLVRVKDERLYDKWRSNYQDELQPAEEEEGNEREKLIELGYDTKTVDLILYAVKKLSSLFVIAGVTNSGKSTLLANALQTVPSDRLVTTIEDPIEYLIPKPNFLQIQISDSLNEETRVTWTSTVKFIKRADQNVVNFGELRKDKVASEALIEAIESGLLATTTVHISSVYDILEAMEKIFFVNRITLINKASLFLNQILLPKLCDNCKIEDTQGANRESIRKALDESHLSYAHTKDARDFVNGNFKTYIANKKGCSKCIGGYKGRVVVYEWLVFNEELKQKLLKEEMTHQDLEKFACEKGWSKNKLTTFIEKLKSGVLDANFEETLSKI